MNAISIHQTATLIRTIGTQRSVLVRGHMGTGKTSILKMLGEQLPNHKLCYFDTTTKDVGDVAVPKIAMIDEQGYATFVPNEEFGIHLGVPVVLMIDEFGKGSSGVKRALTRTLLEHEVGNHKLHPDSLVFATTNLAAEGVGDILEAHQINRVTIVEMAKPTAEDWLVWGVDNDIHHTVLSWVKEFPHCMQDFRDVENPEDNPYIFHPRSVRSGFVTPRSLEAASDIIKHRQALDDTTLRVALMGTIGDRAAMDMVAFIKMADDLPSIEAIKTDPMNAPVPNSAAAVCMIVTRTVQTIDREWVAQWMDYLCRLAPEAQGMFARLIPKSKKASIVMANKAYGEWSRNNTHLFGADK